MRKKTSAKTATKPARVYPTLPPVDTNRRYPIELAADYLFVSRATLWKRVRAGSVATIRDGKRVYLPGSEIARLSSVPQS